MRHEDSERQNASGAACGLGAGMVALLAALGRQADDVARVAGRQADDLARGAFHQADDVGRPVFHGDDLLRQADDVTPGWPLPEVEDTCQSGIGRAAEITPAADDGAEVVLRHFAQEAAQFAVESAADSEADSAADTED
jgi:hypothetical protein